MQAEQRHIERRGKTWYLRWRVPARYRPVESLREISRSLRTDSQSEAVVRSIMMKKCLTDDWEARLAGRADPLSRATFNQMIALGRAHGMRLATTDELANGPLEELLQRIEAIAKEPPEAAAVAFALGGVDLPRVMVSEMAERMARIRADDIGAKNARQLREWNNKWERATSAFIECVGDKSIQEISEGDAKSYCDYWSNKRKEDQLTTQYTNKQIRYMHKVVAAYYEDIDISRFTNPFEGMKLSALGAEKRTKEKRKVELPVSWIRDVLLNHEKTARLNEEARDIAIIEAECGARGSEIYDLPPEHIRLDAEIPHILVEMVEEGDVKRELKNSASIRPIPLVGHALDAMKRHPRGFPRYRGKGSYSATVNKFFRKNKNEDARYPGDGYTISGLRHSFESRLRLAKVDNEERAQLMGHSLKQIRGRQVYGDETELRIRALYLELIAFPTANWTPRPHRVIFREIDRILHEEGYRTK